MSEQDKYDRCECGYGNAPGPKIHSAGCPAGMDRYDEQAAELLPCMWLTDSTYPCRDNDPACAMCERRVVVAAALMAQGLEIERLNGLILTRSVEWGRATHEIAQLKAQLAATRRINEQLMAGNDKLEAKLAEAETFRRSIACRNCSKQAWLFLPNDWGESWSEDRGLHEYYCPDHKPLPLRAATAKPGPSGGDSGEVGKS